ncbi:hypothetical protein QE152_g32438 [Popillia japonica]|uniref:Uncharacterized protein n=1 Tax=Popillia japonica TaxID=7064 RepID=A0AAW1IZ38_POPJA
MREASRERALSVTPMSPRTVRRPSSVTAVPNGSAGAWSFGNEDQLMMAPASHGMRGGIIASSMCGASGFPIQATAAGNGPFAMQSMHYNKHMHPITHSTGGSYMQPSSLGPIPPQPELWQPYEDPMRSTPGPYILPPHQISYPQTSSVPPPTLMPPSTSQMEKTKLEQQESFAHVEESQSSHTNENVPPNGDADKIPMNDPVFENKVDSIQPLMDNGNMHNPAAEPFIPSYGDNVLPQTNGYEKNEVIKLKKFPNTIPLNPQARLSSPSTSKACPGYNLPNNEYDYHGEYIRNYLIRNNCHGIEIIMNDSGVSQAFNYVTYNNPQTRNYDCPGSIDINDILMLENWTLTGEPCDNHNLVLNLSSDYKM